MKTKIKDHPSDVVLLESLDVNLVQLAKEDDEENKKKPCFKMLAYTGAEVSFWGERAIFNVNGMQIASQKSPIFRQHDPDRIAGFSEKIEKQPDGALQIEGRVCPSTEAGREVVSLAAEGFPWQASVGLSDVQWRFVADGESTEINGKSVKGPIHVAVRSVLRESSFVPLGADGATKGVVLSAVAVSARPNEEDIGMGNTDVAASESQREAEKKAAREEAVNEERARVAQLQAEFSENPEFAMSQIAKGNDVKSAKAEYADFLKAENAKLATANAKLEAEAKASKTVSGAKPMPLSNSENTEQPAAGNFIEMARELKAKTGKPLHVCMSEVSIRNPAAYAAQDANLKAKQEQVAKVAASRGRQIVN
jgi:hypothetical protein